MRGIAVLLVMVLGAGALPNCYSSHSADSVPGELEIGQRGPNDEFVPLANGGTAWIVLGTGGLNFLSLSLRAEGIDPDRPDPHIEVTVSDTVLAGEYRHERRDMLPDGDGYILWDLMVPFMSDLCCFVCLDGLVEARLAERLGSMKALSLSDAWWAGRRGARPPATLHTGSYAT